MIAHYCGFNIMKPLPSYWTFDRFIRKIDNHILKGIMQNQVVRLAELGIIDTSFIGLDSTPVTANTSHNNPKSFRKDRFKKEHQPKGDKDCGLGVHTASNQHNEKNYEFYWGYKNHVLVDCITGLPIYEITTTAEVADCTVALDILKRTDTFLPRLMSAQNERISETYSKNGTQGGASKGNQNAKKTTKNKQNNLNKPTVPVPIPYPLLRGI